MTVLPAKQCPQCKITFTPRRMNQNYCSTQCRTNANNQVAKGRYADYKKGVTHLDQAVSELIALREYMATLTAVIDRITEIDKTRIAYNGHTYVRTTFLTGWYKKVVTIEGAGLLLPNGRIIYKKRDGANGNYGAEYIREDPYAPPFRVTG